MYVKELLVLSHHQLHIINEKISNFIVLSMEGKIYIVPCCVKQTITIMTLQGEIINRQIVTTAPRIIK